jgi:EAL and modified HD-GYP domain-containing signal transduction protein
MTSSVLVNSVLGMGLAKLTEGHTAFINLSEDMLFDGTVELLDPDAVVIELLETVRPTPAVVTRCETYAAAGYRFALDDFVFDEAFAPLLQLAEFVKVDVMECGGLLGEIVSRLQPFDVRLLAEKVENKEMHDECVSQGFELFQGYHYYKPETVSTRDPASQSVAIIRLMNLLQDAGVTDRTLEEAFRSDPSLTYKLLRIVNSAALGGRGVESITHALRLLGRDPLYRWLSLLLLSLGRDGGDLRIEIIKAALLRGRMCEVLGDTMRSGARRDIPTAGVLFLVGLFAQIDQLVGAPVEEVLKDIDVAEEVKAALLRREGHAGRILKSTEAYADADWEGAEREIAEAGGDPDVLPEIYLDAVTWAGERVLVNASE